MQSRTNEDKIEDLTKLAAALSQQMQTMDGQMKGVAVEKTELARQVTEFGKMLVVVEQQLKDLRAWKESFGGIEQLKTENALLRKEIEDIKNGRTRLISRRTNWVSVFGRWRGLLSVQLWDGLSAISRAHTDLVPDM